MRRQIIDVLKSIRILRSFYKLYSEINPTACAQTLVLVQPAHSRKSDNLTSCRLKFYLKGSTLGVRRLTLHRTPEMRQALEDFIKVSGREGKISKEFENATEKWG